MAKKKQTFPTPKKASAGANARTALERLNDLETQVIPNFLKGVNEAFGNVDANFTGLKEQVDALVRLLGEEQVAATITEMHAEQDEAQRDGMAEKLKGYVDRGALKPAEEIGERSFVVGCEKDKEGNVLRPGRVQLAYTSIKPEYQEKVKGQKIPVSFPTAEGGSFEITEVYEIVPAAEQPKAETPENPPAEATDAQAAAVEQAQAQE